MLGGAYFVTGLGHGALGALDEAKIDLGRSVEKSRVGGNHFYDVMSTLSDAFIYNWRGEFDEAWRRFPHGLAVAREHGLVFPLVSSLWGGAVVLIGQGRYHEAKEYLEESISLADKSGEELFRTRALNTMGWLLAECGDLDGAIEFNRRGADASRERIGDAETLANAELNLADIYVLSRDFSPARQLLEGIHRIVRNPATSDWVKWRYSMHLFASLGEYCIEKRNMSKATEFTNQCLTLASEKHAKKYLVRGWRLKGEIAMARRQFEEAEDLLRSALTVARAIGNPTQLWKTQILTGHLNQELGRADQSRKSYQSARKVIDGINGALTDGTIRAGIDTLPLVRELDERIAVLG